MENPIAKNNKYQILSNESDAVFIETLEKAS